MWIGKGRKGTVILNLDDAPAQEAPRRRKDPGGFISEQEW